MCFSVSSPIKLSNWDLMKQVLSAGGGGAGSKKRKFKGKKRDAGAVKDDTFSPTAKRENRQETRIVALDCEMVGVGESSSKSALARVVVVNYYGNVLIDSYCLPRERVTDYRTRVSGIRASNLKGAPPFELVQKRVADLLRDKLVVGHALKNDFKALQIKHPKQEMRDTASYAPLRADAPDGGGRIKSRALKELAAEHLGLEIQHGEHSPVEDARAALYLYQKHRREWERSLQQVSKKSSANKKETKKDTLFKEVFGESVGVEEKSRKEKEEEKQKRRSRRGDRRPPSPPPPPPSSQEPKGGDEKKESSDDGYGLDLFVNE